jgi:HEAT repeat protein
MKSAAPLLILLLLASAPALAQLPDDIETAVAELVPAIGSNDWATHEKAVRDAAALVERGRERDATLLLPLVDPLFARSGYGGIGRDSSQLAQKTVTRIGKPATPFLLEKLKTGDERERRVGAEILRDNGTPAAELVPLMVKLLGDRDHYVRTVAIEGLEKLGDKAMPAVEALRACYRDPYPGVRIYARRAVIRIAGPSDDDLDAIAAELATDDRVEWGPVTAAAVLGQLGPMAKRTAPQLRAALKSGWAQLRVDAPGALVRVGAVTQEDVELLTNQLTNDPEREARRSAAGALGQIGPKAKSSVPALRDALANGGRGWWVAAEALGRIGTDEAMAALRDAAANNADQDIRRTAEKALKGK